MLRRWLYTLFLMVDANFRAKCKSRGLDYFELGPGWSYFVEEERYQAYLTKVGEQKEVSNVHAAHAATLKICCNIEKHLQRRT